MKSVHPSTVLWLSLPLSVLLFIVSLAGLLAPSIYNKETPNWLIQASTQDAIDLFLVAPFLMMTSLYSFQRNLTAFLLWGGIQSYLVYTFLIYSFSVHFNILFIPYCLILGLSFYAFLYFLFVQFNIPAIKGFVNERPLKFTVVYFLVISCFFYLLWLSDIIPSVIENTTPASIADAGLFTNPVHVIDLSVCLPGIFLIAIQLKKRNTFAMQLAPAVLIFFVFMDMTIAILMAVMHFKDIQQNIPGIVIMSGLAFISSLLLVWYMRCAHMA